MTGDPALRLIVRHRRPLTADITEFELRDPAGAALPPFTAGAHINVTTPSADVRSYSLTNDPLETHRYVIAVKRLADGRGGSASMADNLREGDHIATSEPRNSFPLIDAPRLLLIAGGIGITPMLAMARVLTREKHPDYRLVYCTRQQGHAAYLSELRSLVPPERLVVHHSHVGRMDFWPFFATPDITHIYCCGPESLADEVRALTTHWPASAIHFEDFAGVRGIGEDSRPFRIRRASDGTVFDVPADRTILHVLADQRIAWPSSCESGTCGTCRMRVVAGAVDHRDLFLTEAERTEFMMPCVSRAAEEEIVLDF